AVGEGTRFDVRLPMPRHEFEPLPDLPTFTPDDVFVGARVLVADDSPVNRLVLGKLLNGLQAEVVMAENGRQALEYASEGGFDWLLIDINMPDLTGDQVVRALRESGVLNKLANPCRAVAVTANVFPEQVAGYLEAGFDACLGKPLRRDDLIALAMQHQF
ncbi:MAG: response regulator, partial [Shimia sp.]|nr:response regulator [Shimia sp.]